MEQILGKRLGLNDQQKRLTEMVIQFDGFCRAHNITYYLAYGTLIGTIRHGQMIPWDDDIDILLKRDEYEKLLQYSSINNEIDIVSYKTNTIKYYHPFSHANLIDNTTKRISHHTKVETNQGLFIDLFPLDNIPDNEKEDTKLLNIVYFIDRIRTLRVAKNDIPCKFRLLRKIAGECLFFVNPVKLAQIMDELSQKYNNTDTKRVGVVKMKSPYSRWDRTCFDTVTEHVFSGHNLMIPEAYDKILTATYGDYMTPPPEAERVIKHPADVFWRI